MRKLLLATVGALLVASQGFAQPVAIPTVTNLNTNDLIQVIPRGQPQVQSFYGTPAQVTHQPGYVFLGTITTDPAATFANGQTNMFAHAAGTITLVTLTTEPNPGDGARECWWMDQAATTLTWTANTGQTMGANVILVGTTKVANCITYQASSSTWFSSP